MTMRTTVPALLAALLLLAQVPAAATAPATAATASDPDEDEPEPKPDAPWSLSLATLVDQASTRGFSGELGRDLTPRTMLRVAADSTDYTSINEAGFKSQGFELGALHKFERFSIQGAIGRWQDTDIVTAKEVKLGGDFHYEPWSVGLRVGYRHSDFDDFTSTADATLPDGTPVPAGTSSHCKLDNTAFGLVGHYAGSVWGGYATAMSYKYKDSKCSFPESGSGVEVRVDRETLLALSGGQLDRMSAVATRYIGREQTLLASSFDAGASWKHGELVVSLDYAHQKDYFVGASSNTYSATGTADLGDHAGIDCTLGLTRGAGVSSGGFVGFALRARF